MMLNPVYTHLLAAQLWQPWFYSQQLHSANFILAPVSQLQAALPAALCFTLPWVRHTAHAVLTDVICSWW